ncbi:MAG: PIN domain-containing protein [Natronosporangium sp.]
MAGRSFIDTNVFIYSVDTSEPDKQRRAQQVLRDTPGIVVSTQVLNEFYNISTRKLRPPLPASEAAAAVEGMAGYSCVPVDVDLVLRAIRAGRRWQLSHWDALMVEAARQAGCDRVLTEDLSDGASYDGLRIENPFRTG